MKAIFVSADLIGNQKIQFHCELVQKNLLPIAKKCDITLGQISVAWALHQPYLSFVIVGVTTPEYIPINLKADSISLSQDTLKEIDKAYALLEREIKDKYNQSVREFRGA